MLQFAIGVQAIRAFHKWHEIFFQIVGQVRSFIYHPYFSSAMQSPDPTPLRHFFATVKPISDSSWQAILAEFTFQTYSKGDFFLRQNELSHQYLFLEKGIMRSSVVDIQGNEVTLNLYGSRSVVLEPASFFSHVPSQENIEALTDCTGWSITFEKLNFLFHSLHEFRELGRAILIRLLVGNKTRTLTMLTRTAEQRYALLLSQNPEIVQHVPLKYIASYLGITDTSLSRIRKEMAGR